MPRILLAALALLLAAAPHAAAQQDGVAWRLDRRDVSVTASGDGFAFTSARSSPLGQDTLAGSFDAGAARLDVRLTAVRPEAADLSLRATWRSLVEYRDADGDGRYGLADPAVQELRVAALPHALTTAPLLSGGHTATVAYTLPENASGPDPLPVGPLPDRRALRLTFTLVPLARTVDGAALDPADVGLSAEVDGFPYREAGTRLALVTDVEAPGGDRLGHDPGGLSASAGNLTLRLAWPARASADGADQPAAVTSVSDGAQAAALVQSWPRGDRIAHHGAASAHLHSGLADAARALARGDWRFYAAGLALVAAVLGGPSLRRLREA